MTANLVKPNIISGANPLFGGLKSTTSMFGKTGHIWIEGEGMLHALYFDKDSGIGSWTVLYNSRHVETETFKVEKKKKQAIFSSSHRRQFSSHFDSLLVKYGGHTNLSLSFMKLNECLFFHYINLF
jgi:carotenoid cleavage dioxygenase-like enzyme